MKIFNPIKKKRIIEAVAAEFKKINEAIPTLNCGGCGVFAYEAYKLLDSLGLSVKLGVITYDKTRTLDCLRNNGTPRATPFSHIVLCIGRKIIDSEGVYDKVGEIKDYSTYDMAKGMSLELLAEWIADKGGWNPRFNREQYVPVIKQELKKVKKSLVALI